MDPPKPSLSLLSLHLLDPLPVYSRERAKTEQPGLTWTLFRDSAPSGEPWEVLVSELLCTAMLAGTLDLVAYLPE
jgi:hypothetical protein